MSGKPCQGNSGYCFDKSEKRAIVRPLHRSGSKSDDLMARRRSRNEAVPGQCFRAVIAKRNVGGVQAASAGFGVASEFSLTCTASENCVIVSGLAVIETSGLTLILQGRDARQGCLDSTPGEVRSKARVFGSKSAGQRGFENKSKPS